MTYRPEIDGLRAIAVLAVVLFHAGIGSAGYVGVDVFFVISGYLITSLLLKEQRIDLLAFYARRVRRIFPAAAVVVLAVLAASPFLLSPEARVHTAQSVGAALVFVSNVFFQLTTGGYWSSASEEMPLLHLWSLSVEEQFYLLWPALLIFTRSRKVVLLLAMASLCLSLLLNDNAAFYQMPARFWELAAGGLIAMSATRLRWASPVGVVVVLLACAFQMHVVVAVIGACLVCLGGTNRFLASKPMVGVGKISYSLYLWHWPLLAFYAANHVEGSQWERLALCGVALLLAIASYYFVEQPFRRMRFPSGRTVVAGAALSCTLALSACAVGLQWQTVADDSLVQADRFALQAEQDRVPPDCDYTPGDAIPKCPKSTRSAIWGDSMAGAWRPAVPDAVGYTRAGCFPLIGYARPEPGCAEFNAQVMQQLRGMDTVYLAARWNAVQGFDTLANTLAIADSVKHVVIIGPTPEMHAPVGKCIRTRSEKSCAVPRRIFDPQAKAILAKLRAIAAKHPNVEVLDVTDHFCNADSCPPVLNGVPLYWDARHVSVSAARQVTMSR